MTLTGRTVRLEPLSMDHLAGLTQAGKDEIIWKYMRYGLVNTEAKMSDFIASLLVLQEKGSDLPFAVVHRETGQAVGMTRYMYIDYPNRSLEIGGTWYGVAYQHTAVNTECKFLLLQYAFEQQDVVRVQFKADLRNERSQRALERIGAVKEGILRDHMILPDGVIRSSVFYSILPREWPAVKQSLIGKLEATSRCA
jgi:RimJ/RimL family protein N-acetyltransferase